MKEGLFPDYMHKEMQRTILKMVILLKASRGKVYPYSLVKRLGKEKFFHYTETDLKNDVYNSINALEHIGLIEVSGRSDGKRAKTYYTITKKGRKALKSALEMRLKTMTYMKKLLK
ncbi:MAG: PadR family transcriptional regulator [Candidatus Micrarchaeota archaeon]|nr:PadR family transcriptional regulator [Candidatus Micrarchaeota archaeon]